MTGLMGLIYQETVREKAKLGLRLTLNHTFANTPKGDLFWDAWRQMQNDVNFICIRIVERTKFTFGSILGILNNKFRMNLNLTFDYF